ncbi:MAG: hypothetical protein AAF235_00655 [Planctomycetota bacterium]
MNRLLVSAAAAAAIVPSVSAQSVRLEASSLTAQVGDTITFTLSVDLAGTSPALNTVSTFSGSLTANDDSLATASALVFDIFVASNSFVSFPRGGAANGASIDAWDWSQDQFGGTVAHGSTLTFGSFDVVAEAAGTLTYALGAGPNPNLIEGVVNQGVFGGEIGQPVPNGSVAFVADSVEITDGPVPCNRADIAAPFNILNASDINAFVAAFLAGNIDLNGDMVTNSSDINAFVADFLGGCP